MVNRAKTRAALSAALAALWLAACGGGGGGDVAQGTGAPASAGAPQPSPASGTAISADTQLAVNQAYQVNAGGPVTLTLPATASIGDLVTITGVSATPWTVAQGAGQLITTGSLNGSAVAGTGFTPRLAPAMWHWVASNTTGDTLVALDIPGEVHVSTDAGATWANAAVSNGANAVHGKVWISAAMTPTADRIVVASLGAGLYMSRDRGATFTRINTALERTVTNSANQDVGFQYESVTISQDGQRIVAVTLNGNVYVSTNGGSTFTTATEGRARLVDAFRAVDSSADGQTVVAAAQSNQLHVSTNAGASFALVPVVVDGVAVTDSWYRVAMSADGNTVLLAGNSEFPSPASNSGLYLGRRTGSAWTWTRASSVTGAYTSVSMSDDASLMSATISNPGGASGQVLVSTDGGHSFGTLATPSGVTDWRAMQLSGDGRSWILASGMFGSRNGPLYTSVVGRTTLGSGGSITGAQGNSVVLQYQGGGVWNVQASTGGAFGVR